MNAYRKTIAAVFGAAGTWCLAALPDGRVTTMEWVALGIAVLTAAGVYAVPNAAAAARPKAGDHGVTVVEVLLVFLAFLLILILVGALR